MTTSTRLLDAPAMGRVLARMASEIVEQTASGGAVVLVGIQRRGVQLADRLAPLIETHLDQSAQARLARHHPLPRRPEGGGPAPRGRADAASRAASTAAPCASWTTCSTPAGPCAPRSTSWPTSAGRGASRSPSWSTAAGASCRSSRTWWASASTSRRGQRWRCGCPRSTGRWPSTSWRRSSAGAGALAGQGPGGPRRAHPRADHGILDTAEPFKEISERPIKKVPALRGKTIVNVFFETSPAPASPSSSPRSGCPPTR